MGWDFIFRVFALSLGFRVIGPILDALRVPPAATGPIELVYAIGVFAFLAASLVSAIKIIFRDPHPLR